MIAYTVLDFFSDNPLLFIGLIVFAIFWIGLAIFFTVNYMRYKKHKKIEQSKLVEIFFLFTSIGCISTFS